VGRISITAIVVAAIPLATVPVGSAFWPLGLWFLLGYAILAVLILRDVWRPIQVGPGQGDAGAPRLVTRHRWLGARVPGTLIVAIGLPIALVIAVVAWQTLDDLHRFFVVAGLCASAFGWWLIRWIDG
jgi:hypothetical protein